MLYFSGRKRSIPADEPASGEPAQKKAQVGRGRRQMRQQENPIRQHLIAKLNHGINWYIVIVAQFKKMVTTDQGTLEERMQNNHLSTPTFKAFNQLDIDTDLPTAYKNLFVKFDEQEREGSGWVLDKILQIEVHTATLGPLQTSSYIELPKKIKHSKGVINIKNEDNMCFLWSVLAHLHPETDNSTRVNQYQPFQQELNVEGITFQTPIHQIPKFEQMNNISINVFGLENDVVVPIQLSRHDSDTEINLLLIRKDDKRHYCLIKNFSRLMNYRTKHDGKSFFCMNCLHDFRRQDL